MISWTHILYNQHIDIDSMPLITLGFEVMIRSDQSSDSK
jgi:hypothetical protein